jgi:hypothetical protein
MLEIFSIHLKGQIRPHPRAMKYPLLTVFTLFCLIAQNATADPETERIRQVAQGSGTALSKGDYKALVDLTFPKVVELMGGRKKMIELLRRGTEEMKKQGSAILSAEVAEPKEVIKSGKRRFAIVPMTVRMKVPEGTMRSQGYLLAISMDEGKTWTFIDGSGLTKEKLAQLLPDAPSQLTLPSKEEPVLDSK